MKSHSLIENLFDFQLFLKFLLNLQSDHVFCVRDFVGGHKDDPSGCQVKVWKLVLRNVKIVPELL